MTFLATKPKTTMYSFVHEFGDESEDHPTPYENTHNFLWFAKALNTIDPRYFDFEVHHPNIQNKCSLLRAKNVVLKYHKAKKDGEKYFIERKFLRQSGTEE